MSLCVGLFGTCGRSKWRGPFVKAFTNLGYSFFNPQKENWSPDDAVEEAKHLAEDKILLFPITSETYASGSLAEVGFSILNAIRLDDRRNFVIFIDPQLDKDILEENSVAAKESLRSRKLVIEHLKKLKIDNVYIVDSMGEMLQTSLILYRIEEDRKALNHLNPQNRG